MRSFLVTTALIAVCLNVAAERLSIDAGVTNDSVYVGESFQYQVLIHGSDKVNRPRPLVVDGFKVKFLDERPENQTSISIINGRQRKTESKSIRIYYELTPVRAGSLQIPSLTFQVGGRKLLTEKIYIRAKFPEPRDDMELRFDLESGRCYVGQSLTLNAGWFIDVDKVKLVQKGGGWDIKWPFEGDSRFSIISESKGDQPIEQKEVRHNGKRMLKVSFRRTLFLNQAGHYNGSGSLVCKLLKGYRRSRDAFSFFDNRVAVYEKAIVPSNEIRLQVVDLPVQGRPATFNGLIGEYEIETAARPVEVNVGDPITLTMRISGPKYLGNVKAPALLKQDNLIQDFKIPKDIAPGKVAGGSIVFTQTIRAKHDKVSAIPPIELPYFDVKTGKYTIAKSHPINIKVRPTRVVTVNDAEGIVTGGESAKKKIQSLAGGISHNYTSLEALRPQHFGYQSLLSSTAGVAVIAVPPGLYFLLLFVTLAIRKRQADPDAVKSRQASGKLRADLRDASSAEAVLDALQTFLGSKLRLAPGAITFKDAEPRLRDAGVSDDSLTKLKEVFDRCESWRYAGGAAETEISGIVESIREIARDVGRCIR